jgi:hypothetical protein
MELLRETDRPVTEICFDVGFNSLGTGPIRFTQPPDGPIVVPSAEELQAQS